MSKKLFIIGTGTDVGKTYVSALIVKRLKEGGKNAAYFKAAMSGNERNAEGQLIAEDAAYVARISGILQSHESMCPYVFESAVSPHLAARMEGIAVCRGKIYEAFESVANQYDYVTVEGSGGICCPIAMEEEPLWLEDIIEKLNAPCLLVADAGLGTINSTLLTLAYLKQRNIKTVGIVFNKFDTKNAMHHDNLLICERMSGVKVIACLGEGDKGISLSAAELCSLYL